MKKHRLLVSEDHVLEAVYVRAVGQATRPENKQMVQVNHGFSRMMPSDQTQ
jgi:hypothetical protein